MAFVGGDESAALCADVIMAADFFALAFLRAFFTLVVCS
jgi:hypothetical protein